MEGQRSLLAKTRFRLTKWLSNCRKIMQAVPEDKCSKSFKINALDGGKSERIERVLGINWKFDSDALCFAISLSWKARTKPGTLSFMNSLFDPLGFVGLVILETRLLYRRLCELYLEWESHLPKLSC